MHRWKTSALTLALLTATLLFAPSASASADDGSGDCPPPSGTGVCNACPPNSSLVLQVWVAGFKVAQVGDFCF